jgi:hypothetical protein
MLKNESFDLTELTNVEELEEKIAIFCTIWQTSSKGSHFECIGVSCRYLASGTYWQFMYWQYQAHLFASLSPITILHSGSY